MLISGIVKTLTIDIALCGVGFIGGALLTTDATAVPSPTPQKTIFQMAKKS